MESTPTSQNDLKPGVIDETIFAKELALCAQLSADGQGKCGWGRCASCGVLPLLYKLHKGQLLEDSKLIEQKKKEHNIQI